MIARGLIIWPLVLIFLLLVFRWLSLSLNKNPLVFPKEMKVSFGGVVVKAQVAQTELEREKGLSGRADLGDNEGLLFVFDRPGFYPFWMKDMNFPIDIIWIGEDKMVMDLSENISPQTYPQTFVSKVPVRYVLEVQAGWVLKKKIQLGQAAAFD